MKFGHVAFTARRHASAVYAVVVCLCLSQVGVLLKRLNVGSRKQRHTIAQGLLMPKISAKLRLGHSSEGVKCRWVG